MEIKLSASLPRQLRRLSLQLLRRRLEGPGAEEEIDDVPFVRLQPVELDGGDGTDVQPIDVDCFEELAFPCLVARNRAAHQRLTNLLDHLGLRRSEERRVGKECRSRLWA